MTSTKDPPKLEPLPSDEIERITLTVNRYLPAEFDREFIVDTIIVDAFLKSIAHVSTQYIRHKCISAWRQRERERLRNKELSLIRPQQMSSSPELNPAEFVSRKILVDEVVGCLSAYERKLVWMKFWKSQTLEEIAHNIGTRRENVQRDLKVALYKMRLHLT